MHTNTNSLSYNPNKVGFLINSFKVEIMITNCDTTDNYWSIGHGGHVRNMHRKLLTQFRGYTEDNDR